MSNLNDFKNSITLTLFGITKQQAFARNICIKCKEYWEPKTHTEAGKKEYTISAMCEECFDNLFKEE